MSVVLIVDDDFDLRDTVRDILEDEGFAVATADDGFAALDYLRANPPPCLILLDWMMPRCDAAQFRTEQRADQALANIPVVLFTADAHHEDKRKQIGVEHSLAKPVTRAVLLEMIARFCTPT